MNKERNTGCGSTQKKEKEKPRSSKRMQKVTAHTRTDQSINKNARMKSRPKSTQQNELATTRPRQAESSSSQSTNQKPEKFITHRTTQTKARRRKRVPQKIVTKTNEGSDRCDEAGSKDETNATRQLDNALRPKRNAKLRRNRPTRHVDATTRKEVETTQPKNDSNATSYATKTTQPHTWHFFQQFWDVIASKISVLMFVLV